MRFLSIFFRLLMVITVLGLVGVLVGREMWLFLGSQQVARQAQRITQVTRWQGSFALCQSGLKIGIDDPIQGIQLRFLDDRNYAIEIDCVGQDPVEVQRFTLPQGVRKSLGSAGFYYSIANQTLSGELSLRFLRQSRLLFAEDLKVGQSWGTTEVRSSLPVSMCAAHGLVCCDPVDSQGVGAPMSDGVKECPGNCFQACQRRPVLLSFQSDPSADAARVIEIEGSSELVLFAYTFDTQDSPIQTVTIDYGDGTQDTASAGQGQFEKEYVCPTFSCSYTVTLQAVDQRGVVSATTRLSSLQVELFQ